MEVTPRSLKLMSACEDAIEWVKKQNESDARKLIGLAMEADRFSDCNWFVTKIMNHEQQIRYAIYAAGLVLDIYEQKYPNDDRPRKAILAAKAYLKAKDKDAAEAAARAAWDAAGAARAAGDAAEAAARAAARAAWAAAEAARKEAQRKCIRYALILLKNQL